MLFVVPVVSGCTAIRPLDPDIDAGVGVDAAVPERDAGPSCVSDTLGEPCDGPDRDMCAEGTWTCVAGVVSCSDDTDDSLEACGGGDEDCDGNTDEDMPVGVAMWSPDADMDGYGDGSLVTVSCDPIEDYVTDQTDCDDADMNVHPMAIDACNGVDDDCSGAVDDVMPCADVCTRHELAGSTYQICERGVPFLAARDACRSYGYQLVKIEDGIEQDYLAGLFVGADHPGHWIGLSAVLSVSSYRWQDGSTPAFTHWAPGEPSVATFGSTGSAAVIRSGDGRWDAVSQNRTSAFYICETP